MDKCEISTRLAITEETLKNAKENDDRICGNSVSATIPNIKYCLVIKPNGNKEIAGVWVGCRICFGENRSVQATIKFSVKSAYRHINMEHFYEVDQGMGMEICSYEDLMNPEKKYIVNGKLTIDMTATLKIRRIKRKAAISNSFLEMLVTRNDKDFCVIVGKEELKVHKFILGARSPVFKAMMESGLEESKKNNVKIIDFSYETVKIAMDFCYDQEIAEEITFENTSELLHFADKYDMEDFHTLIEKTLIEKITASTVCNLANMALSSNSNLLLEHCICFLINGIKTSLPLENIEDLDSDIAVKVFRRSVTRASVV